MLPRRPTAAHGLPAAPVAELGVVRRSLPAVPRMTPAMAHSETNTASYPHDFVPGALLSLDWLGFAHAGTLAAMRCVSPVRPLATMSVRVGASLSLSSARPLRTPSVRGSVCLPNVLPPAPQPRLVSQPPTQQHGPPHAAGWCAAPAFMRRLVATRRGCRQSERTPNHALQPTAPRVTVAAISGSHPSRPCVPFS